MDIKYVATLKDLQKALLSVNNSLSKLNVDLDNVTLGIPSNQFTNIKHQLDERECRASKFYIPVDADSFKLSGITISRNKVEGK